MLQHLQRIHAERAKLPAVNHNGHRLEPVPDEITPAQWADDARQAQQEPPPAA
jgi:hypothetical protein